MADAIVNQISDVNVDDLFSWLSKTGYPLLLECSERVVKSHVSLILYAETKDDDGKASPETMSAMDDIDKLQETMAVVTLVKEYIEIKGT